MLENSEYLKIEKRLAQKSKDLMYVNYNESEGPYMKKAVSFQPRDILGAALGGLPMKRGPDPFMFKQQSVSFTFNKKKGKPCKLEKTPKNITEKENTKSWGEITKPLEDQNENLFKLDNTIKLFQDQPGSLTPMIPTNVNPFLKSHDWENLAFLDGNSQSVKEFTKLVYNLGDPNMHFWIEQDQEAAIEADELDYISDADSEGDKDENKTFRSDEEYESKAHVSETSSRTGNVYRSGIDNPLKSRFTMLKHALPAYDYPFEKFE